MRELCLHIVSDRADLYSPILEPLHCCCTELVRMAHLCVLCHNGGLEGHLPGMSEGCCSGADLNKVN